MHTLSLSLSHTQTCTRTHIRTYVYTFLSLHSCLFSIFISITITPMLPPHLVYRSNILKLPHIQMNSLGRFMKLSRFKKLMLEAVAFSLTPAQISVLRTDFHAIDTDRSGAISLIELQEYVTKVTIFFVIYALYLFHKLEVSSCEYNLCQSTINTKFLCLINFFSIHLQVIVHLLFIPSSISISLPLLHPFNFLFLLLYFLLHLLISSSHHFFKLVVFLISLAVIFS